MGGNSIKGTALAVMAAVLWGVSGTFGQFLFQERGVDVVWLLSIRMLGAGSCLLLLAKFRERTSILGIWKNRKDAVTLATFTVAGMLAVQYTYFAAVQETNAATATVLQYAGPIFIAGYLAIINRRLPVAREFLALVLAVVGVFLLVTHGDIQRLAISEWGLFLGLASAVALAIYTLQPVKLLSRYPAALIIGWAMIGGGLICGIIKAPWHAAGRWDWPAYLSTVFIVIFGTLIPFYAYVTAVKLIGGQKASLLASTEPLAATILGVLWLHTPFTVIDWIGSICIVSTVFLLSRRKASDADRPTAQRQRTRDHASTRN
ncbi:EamA family transporter [Chitinophaga horti]|uniref:EamA family transporter n=1 Tax=Chitinophaga horti TaxID=2920382 RepID=A0ABY6J7S0_9BACT|nr:EamA family transporter [Chitinophaga horti]UYQ95683.1 EamA family transporter [Chitinophaga horti]